MSSPQEFNETQLGAMRAAAWNHVGEPLLTLDAARDWINERGMVLFAPRALQLPAPAPSLVEATLGAAKAAPTMAETEIARGLVSRLVGEGLALPLNLLSVPGDSPDFVVSAQVFSYIFTMRGDKAWKQPPATSGAVKVSPLSLRVFEVLTERGPMSAAELALELGREVTETAILRSLSELWSQLRVLPLLQVGDGVTLWELTTRRFTKAIKAGANAGQPKALSALVSFYLAQVFVATEEEIATFLSPLTARSRVREVLHALMGARQLETLVIDGRTLLHVPGALPATAAMAGEEAAGDEAEAALSVKPKKIGTGRISSFTSERKVASEFRGKPAKSFATGRAGAGAGGTKPSARFGARAEGKSDAERRPFKKAGAGAPEKKSFSKPWDEDRKARPARSAAADSFTKFRKSAPEDRAPLGAREQAGLPVEKRTAPKASFDRASKPGGFAKRPAAPMGEEGTERPTFKPRSYESPNRERPGADRPAKAGGFAGKRPYTPKSAESGTSGFAAKRPYTPRSTEGGAGGFAANRPYTPRATEGGEKRPYTSRTEGSSSGFAKRPYTPRKTEGDGSFTKRPYTLRATEGGESSFTKRPYTPRATEGGEGSFAKRPYKPRADGTSGDFPKRPYTPRGGSGGARPYAKRATFTPVPDTAERTLPKRAYKPRAADADKRVFTKEPYKAPVAEIAPKRSFKSRAGGKSFGGKRPGAAASRPFTRKKPGAGE